MRTFFKNFTNPYQFFPLMSSTCIDLCQLNYLKNHLFLDVFIKSIKIDYEEDACTYEFDINLCSNV